MSQAFAVPARRPIVHADQKPFVRAIIGVGGAALSLLIGWSLVRYAAGIAPEMPHIRQPALMIHLVAVIPTVPLGAFILLRRKGDALHRLLGKLWMVLMLVTAVSAIFIQNIRPGQFSWIHIFVILTLYSIPKSYFAARRGDIATHRKAILGLYLGAALIAGFAAFTPHRTMWWMAFG